ncbi:MAG: hypothetical protein UY62_C0062G0001, partial [Parcubacteria group bacterium GW2011_GWF2_50_9]
GFIKIKRPFFTLFFEGSFIGKGLYDVDAFEKSMEGRFPENLILSHDLLEGCYARSGLVTDVQFYEEFPSGYLKDASRRHRWIRGDWQILPWLFATVRGKGGVKDKNPISFLSQWKIADNLRRSLVPPATVLLFLSGWAFFQPSWLWSAFMIVFLGFPLVPMSLAEALRKPGDLSVKTHLGAVLSSLKKNTVRFFFSLIFLLNEAFYCSDAILRTLWRMFISRRRLLEWRTFREAEAFLPNRVLGCCKSMPLEPVASAAMICGFLMFLPGFDGLSLLLLGLWFFSPLAAYAVSQPAPPRKILLSGGQISFLRNLARRTWAFFENFVTEKDHWLPPDNFQEQPVVAVAHRTSPTNIGLSLLANLTAYDFGYISMGMMFNRTEKTFDTLNQMEKFRGHFYNWYDTETLKALEPLYISSVDSGNLAGHLLVLRSGLAEMMSQKIVSPKIFDGLTDTLNILRESAGEIEENQKGGVAGALLGAGESGNFRKKSNHPRPACRKSTRFCASSRPIFQKSFRPWPRSVMKKRKSGPGLLNGNATIFWKTCLLSRPGFRSRRKCRACGRARARSRTGGWPGCATLCGVWMKSRPSEKWRGLSRNWSP